MKIHKILVPLDGSTLAERALPFATKLAKSLDAEIMLFRSTKTDLLHQNSVESELEVINEAESYLEQVREAISDPTIPASIAVGKVHNLVAYKEHMHEVPELATFEKADLIVMSTHGRTGLSRVLIGSAASSILQHSQLPVVLIRPATLSSNEPLATTLTDLSELETPEDGERIVVTLDGSTEAELVLEPAIKIACQLNATIFLLRVIPPFTPVIYADIAAPYLYDEKVMEQEIAVRREKAYQYLATIQSDLVGQGLKCVKLVREGNVGQVIAGYAQALQANMVMMATHARNMAGRALLGSVTEEVMRLSNMPILMVNTRRYHEAKAPNEREVAAVK